MTKKTRKNNKIRFSKLVITLLLISVAVFTITMIGMFYTMGSVPDSLITSFFIFAGGEAGVLGLIKHGETRYGSHESEE